MNVRNNSVTPVPVDVLLAPIAIVAVGLILIFAL